MHERFIDILFFEIWLTDLFFEGFSLGTLWAPWFLNSGRLQGRHRVTTSSGYYSVHSSYAGNHLYTTKYPTMLAIANTAPSKIADLIR